MEHVAGISTRHGELLGDAPDPPTASLTVLSGPGDSEPGAAGVPCMIESIEGTRMQLRVAQAVAPDLPLRVESLDSLWLGTAEACGGVPGDYILTLQLSHFLRNLPELARLAERFRGRSTRPEPVAGVIDWNA